MTLAADQTFRRDGAKPPASTAICSAGWRRRAPWSALSRNSPAPSARRTATTRDTGAGDCRWTVHLADGAMGAIAALFATGSKTDQDQRRAASQRRGDNRRRPASTAYLSVFMTGDGAAQIAADQRPARDRARIGGGARRVKR